MDIDAEKMKETLKKYAPKALSFEGFRLVFLRTRVAALKSAGYSDEQIIDILKNGKEDAD